jgi:hypothetical protein
MEEGGHARQEGRPSMIATGQEETEIPLIRWNGFPKRAIALSSELPSILEYCQRNGCVARHPFVVF